MSPLDSRLEEYQREVGQLADAQRSYESRARECQQKADILRAKIAGMKEALQLLQKDGADVASAPPTQEQTLQPLRRRQRRLSGPWQQIMQLVDGDGGFGYDDLEEAVLAIEHDANRDTLRSQMSLYKGSGLVEAGGDGRFTLTDAGRRAAGIQGRNAPQENGPVSASSDDRDGGASDSPAPDFEPLTDQQEGQVPA